MEGPTVVLVASSTEGNITAWDVHTGTALTSFKSNACPPNGLSLLGRDYFVAAQLGRGGSLHVWAWHKDQPHQRSFASEPLTAVAASPDGTFLAAGGASGAVHVWETSSGRLLKSWPAHYKAVTCLAWSDGGAVLVSGGEDTMVNAWLLAEVLDVTAGQQLQTGGPLLQPLSSWSDHTLPVTCLAVGAGEASALLASGGLDRTVVLRSLGDGGGPPLRTLALPAPLRCLALDPGEHSLFAGCDSGAIYDVSLVDGDAAVDGGGDGGGLGGGGLRRAALEGHSGAVTCLALSPDAAHLLSGSEDHSVRVWDLRSRQAVRVLQSPARGPVTALLALTQPPFMQVGGSHVASGASQSGKRGPKRPQPLAPFCKYPNAPGTLQPWEGGLLLLDGSAAAAEPPLVAADGDWQQQGAAAAAGEAGAPAPVAAAASQQAVAGGGGAAGDVAALQEENRRLRQQLDRAVAATQQWGRLNAQLQQLCAEQLLSNGR